MVQFLMTLFVVVVDAVLVNGWGTLELTRVLIVLFLESLFLQSV